MIRDETLEVSVADRKVFPVGGAIFRCALAGAVLVALSGCGGADPPAPSLPPPVQGGGTSQTPTATATTGSSVSPGQTNRTDPVSVYAAWWTALEKALATADAREPSLALYGGNPLLNTTRARLFGLQSQQVVQVVRFSHQQQVAARSATRVDILDCVRAPAGTYRDARTGQPRAPAGIRNDMATHDSIRSVLQLVGGAWYVTAIQAGGQPC